MIDLETLGTRPDAAVIQVGAVAFEARPRGRVWNGAVFSRFVQVQDGGGSVDNGTLSWWLQQPNATRVGRALGDGTAAPLAAVLADLLAWPGTVVPGATWEDVGAVWAKPSNFDLPVLASAFARIGLEPPWAHWKTRCARTLFALTGGQPPVDATGLTPHDAGDDALLQVMAVQRAMEMADPRTRA
jgi:exodeoxyribonuclease VIII